MQLLQLTSKKGQPVPISKIIGRWKLLRSQSEIAESDQMTMEFQDDGKLIYANMLENGEQIVELVYAISGNILITNQPSATEKEFVKFSFDTENILILDYEGNKSWFARIC